MSDRWLDPSSDARDRFTRIISDLREQSLLPDPTSVEDKVRVSDMLDRRHQITAELWESRAPEIAGLDGKTALRLLLGVLDDADQAVVDELVSRIPARSVHERMNASAYLAAEVTSATPRSVPMIEKQRSTAATTHPGAMVDSELLGDPADYEGIDPVEDVAIPPQVDWTEADRKAVLDEAISTYGI
ncbi:hypothetical protein O0V02_08535 [Gordonia amicalis]|uniref:hypothetical protein n=1 Tax=Gordonia amicalis TaxID=89053 RepID=UPI0022A78C2A|nr:hypothetical protein [Gordonia amicalis]MCZ0912459.1 hypothetical protein [Gordonia amicalis]